MICTCGDNKDDCVDCMKEYIYNLEKREGELEKVLRYVCKQLEKAINGNAMDSDWIEAELQARAILD